MKNRVHAPNSTEGVIIRGINKQNIFFDEDDKIKFIHILKKFSLKLKVKIISYALMDNHVRFEIQSEEGYLIGELVKRVCISYVQHYFNYKYLRTGSLFQHRYLNFFDDEKVSVNKQIIRYPIYEGKSMDYESSAYMPTVNSFIKGEDAIIDTRDLREKYSLEEYISYVNSNDILSLTRLTYTPDDKTVGKYLSAIGDLLLLSAKEFTRVVKNLRKNCVSIQRIARLMGMSVKEVRIRLSY